MKQNGPFVFQVAWLKLQELQQHLVLKKISIFHQKQINQEMVNQLH